MCLMHDDTQGNGTVTKKKKKTIWQCVYLCQCVANLCFLNLCVELLGSKAVTHTAIEHQTVVITRVIRYCKGRRTVMFNAHSAPSGARAGWFVITHALIIACADILPCKHSQRSTPTCIYSHICKRTKTFTGALRELHRWCLVWGLHSTSKGHLWHLRSLTNDDAQRSFATTKAEQKNWHEREVNKHKAFNKTFFLLNSLQRFSLFFLSHDTTKRKSENCWVTWLTAKSGNNPVVFRRKRPAPVRLQKCEGNCRQHCGVG